MFFDTHAHLDQPEFDADREAVVQRARAAGVEAILGVGISADTSEATVRLAEQFPEMLAAVGIQPNYVHEAAADDWQRIERLAGHPRVVALGETGLDRYWDFAPFDLQREYFARHLQLAVNLGLPVVVHCREAEADVLPMLAEAARGGPLSGVMHSFSGDTAFAAECLALGLHVSFSGAVSYTNKKSEPLRQAALTIPVDRLLIETDSPYITPHPLRGKQKRNEPALIVHTAEALARLRGISLETLAEQTTANAQRLFAR
jgi:TatD DNase family protein